MLLQAMSKPSASIHLCLSEIPTRRKSGILLLSRARQIRMLLRLASWFPLLAKKPLSWQAVAAR